MNVWWKHENNNQHVWLELQAKEHPFGAYVLLVLLVSAHVTIEYPNIAGPGPPKTYPDLFPMQKTTCLKYLGGRVGHSPSIWSIIPPTTMYVSEV